MVKLKSPLLVLLLLIALAVAPTEAAAKPVMNWSAPRLVHPSLGLQFSWGSDVSCPTESFCAAAGEHGNVLVSTEPAGGAAAWDVIHVDSTAANELNGISCPTENFCAAVDWGGNVIVSTEPTDEASWAGALVDSGSHFADVSCPSASFCAAVDRDGRVLTSSEPTGGASAWHFVPGVSGGEFRGISCASASFCAAIRLNEGFNGDVVTSTNPQGGPWTATGLKIAGRPEGISCPSASFCATVFEEGTLVSTEPTGGAPAWHPTEAGKDLEGISCASSSFCAAVGRGGVVVASTEPGSETGIWEETDITPTSALVRGISCPTSGFCAAVDRAGDVYWSTEPAAESPTWQIADTSSSYVLLSSVACPDSSFCAATGAGGNLYTTTEPLGSGSWEVDELTAAFPDLIEGELWDVSCASPSWCVALASGTSPQLFYSTEPGGGMEAWHSVSRPSGGDVSCPTPSFCAMTNGSDEVLTSTEPLGGAETWVATDMELPEWRLGENSLHDVSCASEELCAAGGDVGTVVSSTEPTGGTSAWAKAFVGDPADYNNGAGPSVDGIDCPNDNFCAATTWGETVSTTTEPVGGSAAWNVSHTGPTYFLGPISCTEVASLCVAIDRSGHAVSSFTPGVASEPWGSTQLIDSLDEPTDVSCAPDGAFCLTVDRSGYAVVGTPEEVPDEEGGSGGGGPSPVPPGPPHKHHCKHKKKRKPGRIGIAPARKVSSGGKPAKSRCGRQG